MPSLSAVILYVNIAVNRSATERSILIGQISKQDSN
jgi:hypothetical protein